MLFLYPKGGINIVTAIKESKAYKYCKLCIRKDYDKGAEVLQNQEGNGIIEEIEEKRFNPYHDPRNGRFTTAGNVYVDFSGKSGIIKAGSDEVTISSIENPIEQKHTGKGNPNAILHFDVELNNRQSKILEQLPEYDSRIIVDKKRFP